MRYVQSILFSLVLFLSGLQQSYAQSSTPLTSFPTFNGQVRTIAVSGTTVYVGGDFTQLTDAAVNGGTVYTRNYIAAIDATSGAVLPWDPNAGGAFTPASVFSIAVSGTTVYAAGNFTTIGGQNRNGIAALDATINTNNATAWNPAPGGGSPVALAVSGTTVYVGGLFTSIGGQSRNRIAALDATVNTNNATSWNPNANNRIRTLAVSGTTVYAGGNFTSIGGQSRNYIAALDATTGNASSWDPNVSNAFSPGIYALAVSGSTVFAAGNVDNIGGQSRNGVAALDAATGNATSWNVNANASASVYGLAVVGTTLYTAGVFTGIGGRARNCAAAINTSTGNALAWNPNIASAPYTIAAGGGNVYVGGSFTSVGGNSAYQYFAAFGPATSSATYAATTFPEASANDGSITTTRNITLTNELWLPAFAFTAGTHFTATGVPAGLTMAVNRISSTVARISFTGNATAHANANDATVTLNFMDAAVASNNAAGVTGLNSASLTLDFADPTAAYSATTFPEAVANDGSITQTRTITLTGETWNSAVANGTNFTAGTHFNAANVPAGLVMQIQKTSANVATISFTGNATAHANANDVGNVQINWLAAATQNVLPANITGLNGVNLTLDFNDAGGVVWSGTTFAEAIANDGSIAGTQTITLVSDSWNTSVANGSNFTMGTHFTVANVPAGLTTVITKNSAAQVTISFTGNATLHANANDVSNVQITFLNAAVNSGNASGNAGLNGINLTLDFNNPATATYSGTTFPEAAANNGAITQTRTVTLAGDTWVPAGAFTGGGTDFTATGIPAGLTIAITRITPTIAEISFTGTAAAHANANDATVTLNFTNAAVASSNAAGITGLNPSSLTLDFADATVALTGSAFAEDAANNGMITATQDITLAGDAWIPAGAFASPTDFTATGVPAGLAVAVNRISATVARISFTGAATAHAAANNTSVTLNFTNAALAGANAGAVGGLNPTTLAITFLNPPTPPPPVPAPILPTAPTAFQLGVAITLQASLNLPYAVSFIANGSPAPAYSLVGGALPPGLTFSPSGILSGTPTQQGGYTFTIEASNNAGSTQTVVTFIVGPPCPLATIIEPTSGSIGTPVVIRGYNFSGATGVSFGSIPALGFTVDNDGQITAIVGVGNSGVVQVSTPHGISFAQQGFTYILPEPTVITSVNPAAAVSGDENYRIVLRGRNFSPFATYLVQPETGTNANFAVPFPTVQEFVSSTEARLILPLASRTIGIKRLVVRLGSAFTSATFAVVPGAKPEILSQTVPATTATSQAFSTELIGKNFFRNGFATITVNGNLANARVISNDRARVEIPALLNVLGSAVQVRLANYDGQFAETLVRVQSRIAPQILSVQSRLTLSGATRFSVQGTGFWGVRRVAVQNRDVLLVNFTPTTLEIELPSGFPRPNPSEEAWVLEVENLDGQKYGFRVAPQFFYPRKESATTLSNFGSLVASAQEAHESSLFAPELRVMPNPTSEAFTISAPAFVGRGRWQVVNMRGEEVMSGEIAGSLRQTVDIHALPSGVYVVRLTADSVQAVQQVRIVR